MINGNGLWCIVCLSNFGGECGEKLNPPIEDGSSKFCLNHGRWSDGVEDDIAQVPYITLIGTYKDTHK